MNEKEIKLTGIDRVELAIEAGIGAIPVVGGPLQTLYFGAQNEKRFKRIEKFYNELNNDLEDVKSQLPSIDSIPNKDDFLSILEGVNFEVEKAKSQSKIDYFKNFYKNTLLSAHSIKLDTHSFFLEILSEITVLELKILFYLYTQGSRNAIIGTRIAGGPRALGVSKDLIRGSLNRLINFGLVSDSYIRTDSVKLSSLSNKTYRINKLGIEFSSFIIDTNKSENE